MKLDNKEEIFFLEILKEINLLRIINELKRINGITKFHKFIYFLTYYDVPHLEFEFRQHKYGPYSFELQNYIDYFKEEGLIKIEKYFDKEIIVGNDKKINDFLRDNDLFESENGNTLNDLAQYKIITLFEDILKSTRRIELAASLHFIVWKKEVIVEQEVFKELEKWKPNKFINNEKEEIWNLLIQEKLLSNDIKKANDLINDLKKLKPGQRDWYKFQLYIANLFKILFSNDLKDIKTEEEINEGRKRIDILARNVSNSGFFYDLINKFEIHCPYIVIECKNYSGDLENREFDQISGRLTKYIGDFGILVCRKIKNQNKSLKLVKDLINQSEKIIINLDDDDIIEMIKLKFTEADPREMLRKKLDLLFLNKE